MFTVPALLQALAYQLDFVTPGSSPRNARSRKQMRQRPNLRRKARGRPQRPQRLLRRTSNFGLRLAFSISAFLAIPDSLSNGSSWTGGYAAAWPMMTGFSPRKGKPISLSRANASSSLFVLVTIVMSIPWIFCTRSKLISGKMICSFTPIV